MANNQILFSESTPLELTSIQQQLIEILSTAKYQEYSLGDWYLGALYAIKNIYSPDRYSQAAQSLRELLEKLPRVFVETDIQIPRPDFQSIRKNIYSHLRSAKDRYDGEWSGKTIDARLDKTIREMDRYLELTQIPTRQEQINHLITNIDPMFDSLNQCIRTEKLKRFQTVWKYFEGLAHHKTITDEKDFIEHLSLVERLIIDLLAPITAQDQSAIRAIISKLHPDQDDVEKLIKLISRRGANYAFFFKKVDNPDWIAPLAEKGLFKNLPNIEATGDGRITTPLWWPIFYLQRVSAQAPTQVVEIILGLEETDNPLILREIFSIACNLSDINLSVRLKPLIKRFLKSAYRWGEEDLIINILQKWGCKPGQPRTAAYEIIQYVIAFQPDPKEDEKQLRRMENPKAWNTVLEPAPRFEQWEYQQILEKGVRPLVENEAYNIARILIVSTANMIQMTMHREDLGKVVDGEDLSEFWCQRLSKVEEGNQDTKEILVNTLNYTCEHIYNNTPESIDALDRELRKQKWKVFSRLRQQLYASHVTDQTLPWIRELILEHNNYSIRKYNFEFQLMIRKASEHFGLRLLSESEQSRIFSTIISGPSKTDFRERMGDSYSEDAFQEYQRYFHRVQLHPFSELLSGKYRDYFLELTGEAQEQVVTDDSYSPYSGVRSGYVSYQSPKSLGDLESFTDEELLNYLNDWDEVHRDKDDWLIEINISALASVFQSLFKERIVPEDERLAFWMSHRDNIARPIYVAAMVKGMQELAKDKNFDKLDQWTEFCGWALSHPDSEHIEGQAAPRDESRDHPDWGSSRRAVIDFIDACMDKDVNAPITAREGFNNLLQQVLSQVDWRLDHDRPVLLNRDDQITEAINNTRSRGLESLIHFGFWIRRHLSEDAVSEVTDILTKRIGRDAELALTRPERALLGMHFGNLCSLNREWAIGQQDNIFPQENVSIWLDAFDGYISFNSPTLMMFDILRRDLEFALENLNILTTANHGKELIKRLGQHLFIYYLWKLYPLTGEKSLLARFYDKTSSDRTYWAQLFDDAGRLMRRSSQDFGIELIDRAVSYFDWRFESAEALEIQKIINWLEAECFDPEWRLRSYTKILDIRGRKDGSLYSEVKFLSKQISDHLALVIECFNKITNNLNQGSHIHIPTDQAKLILRAGLNSIDFQIRKNAEHAKENCLRAGRFDYFEEE